MKIIALIPARSGSKGIPHKNIKLYKNKPLLVHSIDIAKESKYISDIYVSTDSQEYKNIAQKYGAIVPFIRPEYISQDFSTDDEFIKHFLIWAKDNSNIPDLIVQLRPTYPNRNCNELDDMIEKMINNYEYTSLRTIIPYPKSPYKMYIKNNNKLIPLFEEVDGLKEPYNKCRQQLPDTYLHNGCVDIIRVSSYFEQNSITGNNIYAYLMNPNEDNDIDTIEDWIKSENK